MKFRKYISVISARAFVLSGALSLSSFFANGQTTDVQGYVSEKETSGPIEHVDLDAMLESDTTINFSTQTDATGFWQHRDIPTAIHNNKTTTNQDVLEVRYDHGAIQFRMHTNSPPPEGKLYNTAGQVLYQLHFEQTDNGVYEATWEKDNNLPRQLLIFSDGTHAAKIAPFMQPTGQGTQQRVNLAQVKKSSEATNDLSYLLRFRHPDFQPLDTITDFEKNQLNYFDVAMQSWPEYMLIVNSKDGTGIDLPDTDWQLVDPNKPQEVLFAGNTGSNALDTLAYIPKTVKDLERVLRTSKAEYEDWQSDVTLRGGQEVMLVSSNVLKEYLYEANIKARNQGRALDSLNITITDPHNNDEILAQLASFEDTTANVEFYAPGHNKEIDIEIKRKGYEEQTNRENISEGQENKRVYDLLANKFFGTITGQKTDGTPLDSLEILIIDTIAQDTLTHAFTGETTNTNYEFRKPTENLANKVEIKRQGYFTKTKNGVWTPGENNEVLQLDKEGETYANILRQVLLDEGSPAVDARIILWNDDFSFRDTIFEVNQIVGAWRDTLQVNPTGITDYDMKIERTTPEGTGIPWFPLEKTIQLQPGDNPLQKDTVTRLKQTQQLTGKLTMGLTEGEIAQDGYDVVIKNNEGAVFDSIRITNGSFMTQELPAGFSGKVYARFAEGDAQGRDTTYYGLYGAPLQVPSQIKYFADTLRTLNLRFTPIYIVDPHTKETVETNRNHIAILEGGTVNAEYFKQGRENVWLGPNVDTTWYNSMIDHIEDIIGIRLKENRVSSPIDITPEMKSYYTLANNNYKDHLGWNITRAGGGPVTYATIATNPELPQNTYMHIGGDMDVTEDISAFWKERIGRWLEFQDMSNSVYEPSFMNPLKPVGMTIPSQYDRMYIVEFFDHRKALVNGDASYILEYLRKPKDF